MIIRSAARCLGFVMAGIGIIGLAYAAVFAATKPKDVYMSFPMHLVFLVVTGVLTVLGLKSKWWLVPALIPNILLFWFGVTGVRDVGSEYFGLFFLAFICLLFGGLNTVALLLTLKVKRRSCNTTTHDV